MNIFGITAILISQNLKTEMLHTSHLDNQQNVNNHLGEITANINNSNIHNQNTHYILKVKNSNIHNQNTHYIPGWGNCRQSPYYDISDLQLYFFKSPTGTRIGCRGQEEINRGNRGSAEDFHHRFF